MVTGRRQFLVGVVVIALLAACGSPPRARFADGAPAPDDAPPPAASTGAITSVVMVGDSITEGSVDELQAAFTAIGITDARVDGDRGRRIEVGNGKGGGPLSGVRTIYAMLAEPVDPDAWVIELGTNDVGSYADQEAYATLITQVLSMLPADRPVVWVNVYRPDHLDHTEMFNAALREQLAERPRSAIVDWYSMAADPDQQILRSDDLHPNSNGSGALSLLVAQALQQL